MNRNYEYQEARKVFNSPKRVAEIMTTGLKKRKWILAGFHAQNGESRDKWDEIKEFMNDLNT